MRTDCLGDAGSAATQKLIRCTVTIQIPFETLDLRTLVDWKPCVSHKTLHAGTLESPTALFPGVRLLANRRSKCAFLCGIPKSFVTLSNGDCLLSSHIVAFTLARLQFLSVSKALSGDVPRLQRRPRSSSQRARENARSLTCTRRYHRSISRSTESAAWWCRRGRRRRSVDARARLLFACLLQRCSNKQKAAFFPTILIQRMRILLVTGSLRGHCVFSQWTVAVTVTV